MINPSMRRQNSHVMQTNLDPPTYPSHMDVCEIEAYITYEHKFEGEKKKKRIVFYHFLFVGANSLTLFFFFFNFHKIVF